MEEGVGELRRELEAHPVARRQRLYPVIGAGGALLGAVSWSDLVENATRKGRAAPLVEIMHRNLVVAHPDETLRLAADQMADHDVSVMPVVDRHDPRHLLGVLSHFDLLRARRRKLGRALRELGRGGRALRRDQPTPRTRVLIVVLCKNGVCSTFHLHAPPMTPSRRRPALACSSCWAS